MPYLHQRQIQIKEILYIKILSFGGRIIGVIGIRLGCPNFFIVSIPPSLALL